MYQILLSTLTLLGLITNAYKTHAHTCMFAHTHMCAYTHTHTHAHIHIHTQTHMYTSTHSYPHTQVLRAVLHTHTHTHTHTCIHIPAYTGFAGCPQIAKHIKKKY